MIMIFPSFFLTEILRTFTRAMDLSEYPTPTGNHAAEGSVLCRKYYTGQLAYSHLLYHLVIFGVFCLAQATETRRSLQLTDWKKKTTWSTIPGMTRARSIIDTRSRSSNENFLTVSWPQRPILLYPSIRRLRVGRRRSRKGCASRRDSSAASATGPCYRSRARATRPNPWQRRRKTQT